MKTRIRRKTDINCINPYSFLSVFILTLTTFLTACQPQQIVHFDQNRLKINVTQDGPVQLSLADLQDAGLTIQQLDPTQLSLNDRGTAVPYTIANNTLIFNGQAATDRYTAAHTYMLELGKPGQLAETAVFTTPNPPTIHLEENVVYESRARTPNHSATWFWHTIQPGSAVTITATLPDHAAGPGKLTMALWGLSDHPDIAPDHDLNVRLNGQPLTTLQWDGAAALTQTIDLPLNGLHPDSNQITFDNPTADNPVDVMLLDWVDIQYTSPSGARPPTNQQTIKPPNLNLARRPSWSAAAGAEFVIITTDALATAVSPLKAQREAAGMRTAIIPIAEIYDNFSGGNETPEAIRAFLADAVTHWAKPPRYVLLIGDATTDYHGYVTPPPVQHIPALMVPVTYGGETISDARLADVDQDGRPDLALGRWPVNSRQEVTNLVKRTSAYEARKNLTSGSIVIDPTDPTFARFGERLWENGRILPLTPLNTEQGIGRLNKQSWLAAYIGHGSLTQWGQTDLLHQNALPSALPPIMLQFTCLTGLFAHPTQPSLSETMLLAPNGPVLIVAATSLTLSQHQEPFATALLEGLGDTAVTRIGDAFLHAQQALDTQTHPDLQEIRDTFVLLGDPTAPILRPASFTTNN